MSTEQAARDFIRNFPGLATEVARQMAGVKPPRTGLTFRMKEVLDFIRDYDSKHGLSPSFDEMCEGLGYGSKSSIHRLMLALEERGHVRRLYNKARAIELIEPEARARADA